MAPWHHLQSFCGEYGEPKRLSDVLPEVLRRHGLLEQEGDELEGAPIPVHDIVDIVPAAPCPGLTP